MTHPFRITTAPGKFGAVVAAVIIILMAGIVGAMLDLRLGYLAATVLTVALVVLTARLFRGASESPAPRAWWRLTATPTIGYVLGVLFLLQGVSITVAVIAGSAPAVVWAGAVVSVAIAAGYFHSSGRQSAQATDAGDPAESPAKP